MCKNHFISVLAALVLCAASECVAQTENPRGVYKLMTITGKQGEVVSPYDQYKICLDNVTLHANVVNGLVYIGKNDAIVFNYTGPEPKTPDDKSSLIYDSDSRRFKLKWWSEYTNHDIFPDNDWCIEQYESGHMNTALKILLDEVQNLGGTDKKNPLIGLWKRLGAVESLENAKKEIDVLKANVQGTTETYMKFTTDHVVEIFLNTSYRQLSGRSSNVVYGSKESVTFYNLRQSVTWIDKTHVVLGIPVNDRIAYIVYEQVTPDRPLWDRFLSLF